MTTIIVIIIALNIIFPLAYIAWRQHSTLNALKGMTLTTFVIGKQEIFTADDERRLSSYKDALHLISKKYDTRLSILFDSLRLPGEGIEFKQGKINMLIDLRNDINSLYNRKEEE